MRLGSGVVHYQTPEAEWSAPALVGTLICPRFSGVRFLESGGVVGAEVAVLVFGWGEHAKG